MWRQKCSSKYKCLQLLFHSRCMGEVCVDRYPAQSLDVEGSRGWGVPGERGWSVVLMFFQTGLGQEGLVTGSYPNLPRQPGEGLKERGVQEGGWGSERLENVPSCVYADVGARFVHFRQLLKHFPEKHKAFKSLWNDKPVLISANLNTKCLYII